MEQKWTRRSFLGAGLAGSLALSGTRKKLAEAAATQAPPPLSSGELKFLRAAMDEIIPAGDGMPAASAVGGEAYLTRVAAKNEDFRKELKKSLTRLQQFSRKRFGLGFDRLPHARRVTVLRDFERQAQTDFAVLRDDVYEAYYTQPRIWKLLGYEFYPTNAGGPAMKPFDESVLAEVRKKPKHYREAS